MYATAPPSGATLHRALPISWWAALSVGAAAIHFAVIGEHFAEWWAFGLAFAVLGWFQVVWPFAYLERPTMNLAWLAIGVNLATVLVWAWSRTAGLPVGPEPGMPEAVGAPDLVATAFEVVLVLGLIGTRLLPARSSAPDEASAPSGGIGAWSVATWIVVAVLSTVAITQGGG
jgi:hypothetical protein